MEVFSCYKWREMLNLNERLLLNQRLSRLSDKLTTVSTGLVLSKPLTIELLSVEEINRIFHCANVNLGGSIMQFFYFLNWFNRTNFRGMNQGRKTPTHSMGTPSVYSHFTRSTSNLKSTHSVKSLRIPWYKRPLVQDAYFVDIQRASLYVGFYAIGLSIFTMITAIFDLYCYSQVIPGSTHYGYYIFSFEFVYIGNKHVRNALIVFALFSLIGAVAVLVTSIILINGLRKEYEKKMIPFLYVFAFFTLFRIFAFLFFSIVNDNIFAYNVLMCILWLIFSLISLYGWVLTYSLYLELSDLTRLEDLAHLRMGTTTSLNASTTHSIAGSRPTTPHSTVSTAPIR